MGLILVVRGRPVKVVALAVAFVGIGFVVAAILGAVAGQPERIGATLHWWLLVAIIITTAEIRHS